MDMQFTFNEIQPDINNPILDRSKATPADLSARIDIPKSALFRTLLQDQDLLKSFLNQVPTILLNDVVQEKKSKKILQTAGLNEVKLLQERWKSRMDQDSRDEARCEVQKITNQSLLRDKHHQPLRDNNGQQSALQHISGQQSVPQPILGHQSAPQHIPGMPPNIKRPIEEIAHCIRTTLETLEREQRKILSNPDKITMIVTEGMKAYYAVDKALKFMGGLYPSLPSMFEAPYKPGCIISQEVGYSPGHPLMSDKLAQFYEQVFGTCTKLHFRFRTILEHYEIELYKRYHGLPPGTRTLEVLEESLTIWFRNLCTSVKYVAAIERAEMTKDYSTLVVMRQTADSLGGISNLLKLAMPHALVPPPPPTMNDILNSALPSTYGGTANFRIRVTEDGASFADVCSNESERQCVGLLRLAEREYSLSGSMTGGVVNPPVDLPSSSTANEVVENSGEDLSISRHAQSRPYKGKKRLPSISAEARRVKNLEESETAYDGDDNKTPKTISNTSEVPKKRATGTGKRGRARKVSSNEDASAGVQATPTPAKRAKKRHDPKDDKLEVPTVPHTEPAIHQPVPQYPPHNVNMMADDFGLGSVQNEGVSDMTLPDPFPTNNYQFSNQNQGLQPMTTGFDYNFLANMQMPVGNQQYAPVNFCSVSHNLYQAATAYLGYNMDNNHFEMPEMQGEQGNIDALACLRDAALGFPPLDEGVASGNTQAGAVQSTIENTDDAAMLDSISFMPIIKMEEATSEAEGVGIGDASDEPTLKQEPEENDADGVTDEEWDMV